MKLLVSCGYLKIHYNTDQCMSKNKHNNTLLGFITVFAIEYSVPSCGTSTYWLWYPRSHDHSNTNQHGGYRVMWSLLCWSLMYEYTTTCKLEVIKLMAIYFDLRGWFRVYNCTWYGICPAGMLSWSYILPHNPQPQKRPETNAFTCPMGSWNLLYNYSRTCLSLI